METTWKEIRFLIKTKKDSSEGLFQSEMVSIFEKASLPICKPLCFIF